MHLTPSTLRLDLKCGKGAISEGEKCHKGQASRIKKSTKGGINPKVVLAAVGTGLAAGMAVNYFRKKRSGGPSATASSTPPSPPRSYYPDRTAQRERNIENARRSSQSLSDNLEARRAAMRSTQAKPAATTQRAPEPTLREQRLERLTARKMESHLIDRGVPSDAIKTHEKHKFKYGVTPEGKWLGVTYTSKDNKVSVSRTKGGEIEFRVNDDTERSEFSSARSEARSVLSKVEQMFQESLADLPDSKRVFAFAEEGDDQHSARLKLYKRYGLKPNAQDPFLLEATVGELKRRKRRTDALTPQFLRLDAGKRCGQGYIAAGKQCQQKGSFPTRKAIAAGLGVAAVGAGAYALHRHRTRIEPVRVSFAMPAQVQPGAPRPALPGDRTTRRLTGTTPKGLLPPSPPRQGKTARMRKNTGAAVGEAERRIAQTAREEVRRIAQIGNTMAAAGEASGMAAKTGWREVRLRVEAARRRYEPGYRRGRRFQSPPLLRGSSGAPVQIGLTPRTISPQRARIRRSDALPGKSSAW